MLAALHPSTSLLEGAAEAEKLVAQSTNATKKFATLDDLPQERKHAFRQFFPSRPEVTSFSAPDEEPINPLRLLSGQEETSESPQ